MPYIFTFNGAFAKRKQKSITNLTYPKISHTYTESRKSKGLTDNGEAIDFINFHPDLLRQYSLSVFAAY